MTRKPTSLRLSREELDLLDAWASWFAHQHHGRWGRAEVIRRILQRATPPAALDPIGAHVREAHAAAFPHSGGAD